MPHLLVHLLVSLALISAVYSFHVFILHQPIDLLVPAILLLSSNLIDLDHLLARPIYDPTRCGINFHPGHSWYMIPVYSIGLFFSPFFFIGVFFHLGLDCLNCLA